MSEGMETGTRAGTETHVELRDVVEADLQLFYEHEHDPENVRRSKFQPRERERFMTHWRTRVLGDPANLVLTALVDGEPAGNVVSWWEQDRRFLGYVFGRKFWGRGIGTRAVRLFLERERNRPLYADPYHGNAGSVRLLERLGFEREGTVKYGENEHITLVLKDG